VVDAFASDVRTFASIRAKTYIYFSLRTYLFYSTYSFFKTPDIRLSILLYILLKYQFFLIF